MAILSENRVEMALADLACLSAGIVNLLVPANATDADVAYMLGHCGAQVAVVGSAEQLEQVLLARRAFPPSAGSSRHLDRRSRSEKGVLSIDEVATRGAGVSQADSSLRVASVRSRDLATVIVHVGHDGLAQGDPVLPPEHRLQALRRALAIPEIGEDDVFLCYLPLFHTFGRFLELMDACSGARPTASSTTRRSRRSCPACGATLPTVFISVPKKWIQLHAAIAAEVDLDAAPEAEIRDAARRTTGGRLAGACRRRASSIPRSSASSSGRASS